LVSRQGERTVGFALRYHQAGKLFARVAGFDYDVPRKADYFNLVFYEAIKSGAAGLHGDVHLGLGALFAKLSRGCLPEPVYHVYLSCGQDLEIPSGRLAQLNRARVQDFQAEFGPVVLHETTPEAWVPENW
jgi:uncharacterized protein